MKESNQRCFAYFEKQLSFFKGDSHHIVPVSRGGCKNGKNKVIINEELHRKYHNLFVNRTPEEILDFLVCYFWNGDVSFVENYLAKDITPVNGSEREFQAGLLKIG